MTDHEAIQGDWVSVAPSRPGYEIPISAELMGSKLTYQLQPDNVPKRIFIKHRDAGNRTHSSSHGVYELSGDQLTVRWTYSDDTPPWSVTTDNTSGSVLHLRRVVR
ncbi:MAG: hypothetical protein MK102_07060 [Fuerstiella sp.]|nr:hypothetical protein [Fuerstiella sp.]